ncbi:unnamed protein product [Nyctereutes procyonoides]|uniref:(raccoon dog) hypothetical protein n=1 Tax=Nyctereutes procyonoides TaxID=34880 RepID=A0A811XZY5_NYCPR|nr:unnamed protein product [Nyctereutes procyonoides]
MEQLPTSPKVTQPGTPAGSSSPMLGPYQESSGKVGRRDREVGRGSQGPAGRAQGRKRCPEPVLSLLAWPLDIVPELLLPSLLGRQAARPPVPLISKQQPLPDSSQSLFN